MILTHLVALEICSAARDPSQIFVFLETLYGSFDQAALTHGVFKIEVNE